jgi:DNA transformation protein and related proteins
MVASSEFVGFVVESLQPIGRVTARRMFGGHGLFMESLMFGLITDDRLYLKVDDGNRAGYEAQDLQPFTYQSQGKTRQLSYREAPGEAFDDPDILCAWGREAFGAALRADARKTRRKTSSEAG